LIFEADAQGVIALSPTLLADRCYEHFAFGNEELHVRYLAIEHAKQMARSILARRFDVDGEENEAMQGDMFSGHLQSRYPIPVKTGEQPQYKPREALTQEELDWNISQLRKSAAARLKHADALQAYRDNRAFSKAA
jgi:hypothetical protein